VSESNVPTGGTPGGKASDRLQLSRVTAGIATVVAASTAGFGVQAQEQKPAAEATPLPPLEVTSQKAPAKKAKPKKAASSSAVAPTPQGPSAPTTGPTPTPSEQLGLTPPSGNTNASGTGLGRLPGTLQDTPQTVNVVSQRELKEKGTNTLEQALRSVPGVTVAIGEGGGGMNGDQFRIRGFQAKGDMYVDGLRDFGVYVRDSFAFEQVEVFKGPTSESFGMGTTGGAINVTQKTAHLGDSYQFEASIGTDDYYRAMVDVNKQVNATTAMRAVALYHDQEFADRDYLYSERFGFLGSLAFGLGTDTKLTLNYMHQNGERLPDFGVPIIDQDSATGPIKGKPVTEYGVPRSNFYGKETDIDDYSVDMVTSRLTAKVNDSLTIHNDTRVAWYGRYFAQTVPSCGGSASDASTCLGSVVNGTFSGTYGIGGPAGFDQDSWGAQNITTAVAKFKTGHLKHEFVAGIDLFYQNDERTQLGVYNSAGVLQSGSGATVKDPTSIGSPNYWNTTGYYVAKNPLSLKDGDSRNYAVFASDHVWLTDTLSVIGGIRYDDYEANYSATNTSGVWGDELTTSSKFWSPKLSVMWEPSKQETYYVSWARSYTPVGQFITNDNAPVPTGTTGPNGATTGQYGAEPEENELWEAGAKWSVLNGRLGFTAALFRVDKGNSSYSDIGSGDTITTGEEHRVQGVELGVTGSVTDAWIVQAAYTYLDSEVLFNPTSYTEQPSGSGNFVVNVPENAYKGNKVPFVPENIFTLWTTYEISKHLPVAGKILVGGGVTYADGYYVNSANTSEVPSNFTFDGLVSYEYDGWRYALNGYNLTDELNYDATMGNRAVVAPGRSGVFTIGKKF